MSRRGAQVRRGWVLRLLVGQELLETGLAVTMADVPQATVFRYRNHAGCGSRKCSEVSIQIVVLIVVAIVVVIFVDNDWDNDRSRLTTTAYGERPHNRPPLSSP